MAPFSRAKKRAIRGAPGGVGSSHSEGERVPANGTILLLSRGEKGRFRFRSPRQLSCQRIERGRHRNQPA